MAFGTGVALKSLMMDDTDGSVTARPITMTSKWSFSTVYSDADKRKHQSSASLAFVWGIHRGPMNSPHKWPVTRKMFPFNNNDNDNDNNNNDYNNNNNNNN